MPVTNRQNITNPYREYYQSTNTPSNLKLSDHSNYIVWLICTRLDENRQECSPGPFQFNRSVQVGRI